MTACNLLRCGTDPCDQSGDIVIPAYHGQIWLYDRALRGFHAIMLRWALLEQAGKGPMPHHLPTEKAETLRLSYSVGHHSAGWAPLL
jgi:hypothetical protein